MQSLRSASIYESIYFIHHTAPARSCVSLPIQWNSHRPVAVRSISIVLRKMSLGGGGPIVDAAGALRGFVREAGGCAVVDGGLGTELEAHGADLHDALWSAKCLASAPHLIRKVKRQ